jgi:hypothetical protein
MTTYAHGVYTSEAPTSIRPPIEANAGLPVFFGVAPVVLGDRDNVNKPVLCTSYAEFVAELGEGARSAYSLCRCAYGYFGLYGVSPAIFVNVLDPDNADHMEDVARAVFAWAAAEMTKTIAVFGVDHETVVLDNGAPAPVAYTVDTDYTLAYDDDGYTVVTRIAGGAMGAGALVACNLTYSKMDPTGVDAADVVGGATAGGVNTGIYVLEDVYPRLQMAPGMVLASGYSHEPTVKAALVARAASINGVFKALVVVDLETDEYQVADYTEAVTWKTANGYTDAGLVCCWPKFKLGVDVLEASIHLAGVANLTDANQGGGVPYISPSNKTLQIDGACLDDGSEVFLTLLQANVLNGAGIVTALNWGGWKLWGNNTAAYPGTTDPKDRWISIRRMFLWLGNTQVLTYFGQVDSAMNRRLIDSVVDSSNIWLNGLKAQGAILAGETLFAEADNPLTSLLAGRVKFRTYWTPPPPAEKIEFVNEYDTAALAALFG